MNRQQAIVCWQFECCASCSFLFLASRCFRLNVALLGVWNYLHGEFFPRSSFPSFPSQQFQACKLCGIFCRSRHFCRDCLWLLLVFTSRLLHCDSSGRFLIEIWLTKVTSIDCGTQIFFTGRGYGVVTPYTYWKTSVVENEDKGCLLLTNEEALARAHGIVESYPHGTVVDKAVQTNLVDVICRGNGTDKVLFGRTLEELAPQSTSQRHRSLRMFHVSSSRRMSWSELKGGGSSTGSGGSLKLSQAKAKKLMEECGADDLDDWGVHRVHSPAKTNKGSFLFLCYVPTFVCCPLQIFGGFLELFGNLLRLDRIFSNLLRVLSEYFKHWFGYFFFFQTQLN